VQAHPSKQGVEAQIGIEPVCRFTPSSASRATDRPAQYLMYQHYKPLRNLVRTLELGKLVAGGIVWERHAAEIAEMIRLHLSPDQPDEIRRKYVWLAEYWN
jgi:hypothetical protein